MKTTITADEARALSHAIQISGTACAAAHDISIGLEAIRPYTDRRNERLLSIMNRLAMQETKNPDAFARNRAFILQFGMDAK